MKLMDARLKRLHPDAVLPSKAHTDDAGFDLVAIDDGNVNKESGYIEYATGWAVEMPTGYHIELFPRSSISKYDLVLANGIGLVDNVYRGPILIRFKVPNRIWQGNSSRMSECSSIVKLYKKGDKIAQMVVRKTVDISFIEVDDLSETVRGAKGFGSSG